jgi:hypothetical protein
MPTVIEKIDKYITESSKVQKKLIKEDIVDNDFTADVIDLLNSLDDSVLDDTQLILKDRILSAVDGLDDLEINLEDVDDVEDVDDELDQIIDEPAPEVLDEPIDDLDYDLEDLDYVGEATDREKKEIKDKKDTIKRLERSMKSETDPKKKNEKSKNIAKRKKSLSTLMAKK